MAKLTFNEICEQGALLGQNNATPIWVARKMKAWLRKHYAAWPWPFLLEQATGITFAAGSSTKEVGAGLGGITNQISRVFGPVYYRSANAYTNRGRAEVRQFIDNPVELQGELNDPNINRGRPRIVKVQDRVDSQGLLYKKLFIEPVADGDYVLSFSYLRLPADLGASDYPEWPNEMTLLQAAKVAALEYDQTGDTIYTQEAEILSGMVTADRTTYGTNNSFGDTMQLDGAVFLP